MASIQESLRSALGADPTLTALVGDRIYPGEVPTEETPTPWLFYALPESVPIDDLDGDGDFQAQVEFHALADDYATAKQITDAVLGVLNYYSGGQITRAFWRGTSEESTDEGYHHVCRFDMTGLLAIVLPAAGSQAIITTGANSITLTAGGHVLTLTSSGLFLDGGPMGTAPDLTPYARKDAANTFTIAPQTIQADLDTNKGLIVKAHSGTQSANLLEIQDSAGVGQVRMTAGKIGIGQDPSFALDVKHAKGTNQVVCVRTGGVNSNTEGTFSFSAWDDQGAARFQVLNPNGLTFSVFTNDQGPGCYLNFINGQLFVYNDDSASTTQAILWGQKSSTTSKRSTLKVSTPWVSSTDATRKARAVFEVFDTAAREFMRAEANGTVPMIGFLGAAASGRPTVTGSRGGNAALASLLTALATLGLVTDSTTA